MEIQQMKRKHEKTTLQLQSVFRPATVFRLSTIERQRRMVVVLMSTTCAQLVILSVLVGHWSVKRNDYLLPSETVVCTTAYRSPSINVKLFDTDTQTIEENYCESASDVTGKLLRKAVDERYNNEANPAISNPLINNRRCRDVTETRVGVNLDAISSFAIPKTGEPTKIYWVEKYITESFCNVTDVERKGTISIEGSGFYFISSKLTLLVENGTYDPSYILPGEDFRHYIKLISNQDNTERILMEKSMSKCHMLTGESEKTSHIEAIFKLVKGDRIYVAASHTHKIICAPLKNSFAIYSL